MKFKDILHLLLLSILLLKNIFKNTYVLLGQANRDRDSNVKFCSQPGLEAQKVEKHWFIVLIIGLGTWPDKPLHLGCQSISKSKFQRLNP